MPLFSSPTAFLGLDVGTSSMKLVELVNRHKRIEVGTYAEANLPNLLVDPTISPETASRRVANTIQQMLEQAQVSTDATIAALPNGIVFSTVINLPDMPDKEMNDAVHFSARDIVPADLDEMSLGWKRLGAPPHMEGDGDEQNDSRESAAPSTDSASAQPQEKNTPAPTDKNSTIPIFITAAPKDIVHRYNRAIELAGLELVALEVETFPLVRSLLNNENDSGLIIDLGDQITTFHIIDQGTPRLSHSIDFGGRDITRALTKELSISSEEADKYKTHTGLAGNGKEAQTIHAALAELYQETHRLLSLYEQQSHRRIRKAVLIGGSAKLSGLVEDWRKEMQLSIQVGNPWRGLSYPQILEERMRQLGPTYGVAIGLAERGALQV